MKTFFKRLLRLLSIPFAMMIAAAFFMPYAAIQWLFTGHETLTKMMDKYWDWWDEA